MLERVAISLSAGPAGNLKSNLLFIILVPQLDRPSQEDLITYAGAEPGGI